MGMSSKSSKGASPVPEIGVFDPTPSDGGDLDGLVGQGISNDNMIVNSANGVTLALKSQHRFVGDWCAPILDGDRYVFTASTGLGQCSAATCGSSPTTWDYLYVWDVPTVNYYGIRIRLDFNPAVSPVNWYQFEYPLSTLQGGDSQSMGFNWYPLFVDGVNSILPGVTFSGTANYQDINVATEGRYDVVVEIFELSSGTVIVTTKMSVVTTDDDISVCTTAPTASPTTSAPTKSGKTKKSESTATTSASTATVSASVVGAVCGVVVIVIAVMFALKRSSRATQAQAEVESVAPVIITFDE